MPNPFDAGLMTTGYASARPPVHPHVIEAVRARLGRAEPFARALDVGCGAGLSARALGVLARQVVGLDPVESMLRHGAVVAPKAQFIAASAEALPLRDACCNLIAAAGSLNYVDLDKFFPEARRVLKPGGILLVYDFAAGRSFRDSPDLDAWFDRFRERYPAPASEARPLNPGILGGLNSGFALRAHADFEIAISLEPGFYVNYMMTETNVAAAIRRGTDEDSIRLWCAESLSAFWRGGARDVLFRGYYACLAPK